jgi:hypothetical protein
MNGKSAYVCGPLTELPSLSRVLAKRFYERIADACTDVLGERAFVPHEHFDPLVHVAFAPQQVDEAERRQVCERTNLLIVVVSFGPSWGGGIEVEMARQNDVPVIILRQEDKKVSRLLLGNPAVRAVLSYKDEDEAISLLRNALSITTAAV